MPRLFVSWVFQSPDQAPEFGCGIIDAWPPEYEHGLFNLKHAVAEHVRKEEGRPVGLPVILYFIKVSSK